MEVSAAVPSSSFVTVDKCSEIMATCTPKSEIQANLALKRVKKSNNMKRRYRGKRKPKRKENRRRARPGRSRSGFRAMGAPFNNNEFLINQRDDVQNEENQIDYMYSGGCNGKDNREDSFLQQRNNCHNICSETICKCEATCCETERDSSRSADTSDYDSLHSPTDSTSSSGSSNHWDVEHTEDDISSDELFDIDFAMRNFEADYSAQQWQMKQQLVTLPRQQLEMRCSLLMDQLKDLEERRQVMHGMDRVRELELELESLREENRRLKGVAADSLVHAE